MTALAIAAAADRTQLSFVDQEFPVMQSSTGFRFQWRALTSVLLTLGFMRVARSVLAEKGGVREGQRATLTLRELAADGGRNPYELVEIIRGTSLP